MGVSNHLIWEVLYLKVHSIPDSPSPRVMIPPPTYIRQLKLQGFIVSHDAPAHLYLAAWNIWVAMVRSRIIEDVFSEYVLGSLKICV